MPVGTWLNIKLWIINNIPITKGNTQKRYSLLILILSVYQVLIIHLPNGSCMSRSSRREKFSIKKARLVTGLAGD